MELAVFDTLVSTHSRPKAAGSRPRVVSQIHDSFNTQPPEGGWRIWIIPVIVTGCFNTQPPEGGWF